MLNTLPSPKTTRKSKIVGRGISSGKGGHTTGRGTKGQKSRSGYRAPGPNFEGGQSPLAKRIPKLKGGSSSRGRGFITSKLVKTPVQLSILADKIKDGAKVTLDTLADLKLINFRSNKNLEIKVVFDKEISKKINLEGIKASKTAEEAIKKAGGSVN